MARNRFSSFMSSFSNRDKDKSPSPTSPPASVLQTYPEKEEQNDIRPITPQQRVPSQPSNIRDSPQRRAEQQNAHKRNTSRPMSMVQTYQPPLMELDRDTLPELQPIFTFLNSHGNKLYQEGYFLKLDDQNSQGRPNADRTWTECFAQLVGTILSLWDAAELDAAGSEGEVLPKFINLTDASIKMIESLPIRSNDDQPLQNVLSISTAGKNRYLLHFNSHHSLVQWTAAIRLATFEYTTLQESYTGALIAGKGKTLNNINQITSKTTFEYADMVRVRFGAGTPWRQCWCVVYPPDEKEVKKLEKELKKKKSVYDRSKPPILRGSVKFFDSRKIGKKTIPIATITDAFSAYAIYPQSKPLIDASTLVKLEGTITVHSNPPTVTEAFVFVMPEVHAAVSGFEIMLRWLFPVYDTFGLYGRPTRLVADPLDPRSLMFGMPTDRRYGYLELLDVAGLISTEGSQNWKEAEWRKHMKDLTQRRMTAITAEGGSRRNSRRLSHRETDRASIRSTPALSWGLPPTDVPGDLPRTDSAPSARPNAEFQAPYIHQHHRSVSDGLQGRGPRLMDNAAPPLPPPHINNSGSNQYAAAQHQGYEVYGAGNPVPELQHLAVAPVQPVSRPPGFSHAPGAAPPPNNLTQSPELRRAKSRMSNGTLNQLAGAGGLQAQQRVAEYQRGIEQARIADEQNQGGHPQDRGVNNAAATAIGPHANPGFREGMLEDGSRSFEYTSPDYPASGETSTFSNTNIPPNYHSENLSTSAFPIDNQPYNPSGLGGPPINGAPNPVIAAVAGSSHGSRSSYETARGSMDNNQNSRNIQRKPVPGSSVRTNDARGQANPQRLDQIGRGISNTSGSSSNYDERPLQEFASAEHHGNRPSYERPRTGMMKTVGGYGQSQEPPRRSIDMPRVDFGPTINYAQNTLPTSSSGPNRGLNAQRQGSPQRKTPESQYRPEHQRNQSSRQMAWRPGMAPASADVVATRAMTPDEFVQQRAQAASQQPQYAHQRQKSSTNTVRASPAPPISQAKSEYYSRQDYGPQMPPRVPQLGQPQQQYITYGGQQQGYGQQMPPRLPQQGQPQQQYNTYGGQQQEYGQSSQEEMLYQQRRMEMQREAFQNQGRSNGPGFGRGQGNGQGQYRG